MADRRKETKEEGLARLARKHQENIDFTNRMNAAGGARAYNLKYGTPKGRKRQ